MADILTSNLYPPTVPTYGEPFIISVGDNDQGTNNTCIVPFSISKYNTASDFETDYIQVTVFKQNTNLSALNSEKYPCGIMLTSCYLNDNGEYYIKINSTDIESPGFQINNFYRVQIRLTKSGVLPPETSSGTQDISTWLTSNIYNFSEWSTVCLVRGILQPVLRIRGIEETDSSEPIEWKSSNVDIVGKLYFMASPIATPAEEAPIGEDYVAVNYIPETDYLKEYTIKLYDQNDNLSFDSGIIYANTYVGINEINYTIKRIFREGERYKLEISYLTKVGYPGIKTYYLLMLNEGIEKLNVNFTSVEDAEKGRISLRIKNVISDAFTGNLIIRRSEGDTDFTIWEDIANISIDNQILDITWHDYTIQSGKWYRYGVQTKDGDNRGILTIYDKDLMVEFEDIFLNAEGKQVRIRYDSQISSFQHTISENKIDTIGSKYPFIKRNGNMEYKQFPISGLITSYMDFYTENESIIGSSNVAWEKNIEGEHATDRSSLFTSKEQIYGEELLSLYDVRMQENNSNTLDTIIYEKDFRDKVKEFLYKNNVKLFRSATEGNILVKLMNISFTPNQLLGRKIWSFNATAYEIDECSIENYDKYGIQLIGSTTEHFEYINNYLGQLNEVVLSGQNVINILEDRYQKYCKQNYIAQVDKIVYLKIQFNDKPYLIKMGQNGEIPTPAQSRDSANTIMGHLVEINGQTIVIKEMGIYELKNEDVEIKSISFPVDSDVMLDYELVLSQTTDKKKIVKSFSYKKIIGQLRGIFEETDELISELRRKYSINYSEWYQELTAVNGMRVEADEGTIFYVKEEEEAGYQKHVIGPTESLDFYDPESIISGVYFYGKHFYDANGNDLQRNTLPLNKIKDSGISVNSIEEILEPQKNNTYLVNGVRKLYYRNNWYNIDDNNDVQCPVDAMVDYYCECARGFYATPT